MESECINLMDDPDWNAYLRAYLTKDSIYRRYLSRCIGWVWKDKIKIKRPRYVKCPKEHIQFGAYICGAIIGDRFGTFLVDEYGSMYYPKHPSLIDSFNKGINKEKLEGHKVFNSFFRGWRNGKSKRSRKSTK